MTPLFPTGRHRNIHHNLVHAVRGSDVALTMIDGKIIVEEGTLKTADLPTIIGEARKAAQPLFERRDAL
jgi:5-methylthioadenosine/S-adenosylhomocysteine deaminase